MTLSKVKRNMPTKIFGLAFIMLFCSLGMKAQNFFHRTYPAGNGKEILSIAATQLSDGNFVSVEMELDSTDMTNLVYSDTIIVTNYKPKGDILWTNKIYVDEAMLGFTRAQGSIVQGDNDTIYFSLNVDVTDKFNKIIGAVTNGGIFVKVRSFSTNADGGDGNEAGHYLANYNNSLFSAYTAVDTNINKVALARRSYEGQDMWSKLFKPEDQDVFNVTDIHVTLDTSLAIVGGIDSGFYYTVLDTLGAVAWSRKYQNVGANVIAANVKTVALTDTTFVVSLNNLADNSSHIISAAQNGEILWAKRLVMSGLDSSLIIDIALDENNDIIVGGSSFLSMDTSFKFIAKLTDQGNTLWKYGFPGVKADYNPYGDVFGTSDGGSALITSSIEENKLRPSFIKLVSVGEFDFDSIPGCNTLILEDIFTDILYQSDTLVWNTEERGVQDTVAYDFSANVYDVPVLSLETKFFCPNEPIDWLFSAATRDAVDYKWSTDTNRGLDTLRVFDEEKYSVTVTIGKGVCYMLCDTAQVDRYELPKAQIGLSLGNWCTNGKQTLSLAYTPGHPNIKTITWSTGETGVNSIEIGEPRTYSVTIVDECDEVATAEIAVGEFPRKITAATIAANLSVNCFEGEVTGILSASGNSSGLPAETYLWSTGAMTKEIAVNDSPILTYSVTVTDFCGTTAVATYSEPLFGDGSGVNIVPNASILCLEGKLILNAVTDINGNYTYSWSTNVNTPRIEIETSGNYVVTVTDKCGNTATDDITVNTQDFIAGEFSVQIDTSMKRICMEKILILIANPTNSTVPNNDFAYKWSTDETGNSIEVIRKGNYSVTVTDKCGTTRIANINIEDDAFNTNRISNIRIISDKRDDCSGIFARADFDPENDPTLVKSYLWSNGGTTKDIDFTGKGTYSVTVTDICENTYVASAELDVPDINYANVFFPDGIGATFTLNTKEDTLSKEAHVLNRSFGPINLPKYCIEDITNYEFYIFNRWGQQVFETKDIKVEWDGTNGDRKWQSDTYVWVVKYNIFGFEKTQKGDVTLIR